MNGNLSLVFFSSRPNTLVRVQLLPVRPQRSSRATLCLIVYVCVRANSFLNKFNQKSVPNFCSLFACLCVCVCV